MRIWLASALGQLVLVTAASAQTPSGEATFQARCAACHVTPDPMTRAPAREVLGLFTPEVIVNSLTNGKMQPQAAGLSEAERVAVAEYLAGSKMGAAAAAAKANQCKEVKPMGALSAKADWNGWGNGVSNTRFQSGGLTAADLPKLKLKWAFGYANVGAARAQPAVAGGRIFVASENTEVHALDAKTGCSYWTFKAQSGVRTALSVGPYKNAAGKQGLAVFFGDLRANAYAVDAQSGQQIWTRKVDDNPFAGITGAPTYHNGKLFVPVQGLGEEGRGIRDNYPCCSFRGSLSALNANTGEVIWKTYTIEPAKPRGKTKDGVQAFGPAGGSIWSSPTVDAKRGVVYAATGNGYADPPQPHNNSVLAYDLKTGQIKWGNQLTPNDAWAMGCKDKNPDLPTCPETLGPDYDFSASPMLVKSNGRELLVLPQKSGVAYALDPDKQGALVWERRIGEGSGLGGAWGGATDGAHAYFGIGDILAKKQGGMRALNLATGEMFWLQPPQPKLCGDARGCNAAQGGAVTVIPGAVLSGALDGGLRAYSTKDGAIVWLFDANREFSTVNGVKANGGGMDGPGPVVAGGMLYVNSGYGGLIGRPGNVLLAFGLE